MGKPFSPDGNVAAVAAIGAVGQLVPQLSFVLQGEIPKKSLVGDNSDGQGEEGQQREKGLHFPGPEKKEGLGTKKRMEDGKAISLRQGELGRSGARRREREKPT